MPRKKSKSNDPGNVEVKKILDLAVSCKLLTPAQEKEILPKLMDVQGKNSDKSTARLLFKEKVLPKDKIEFLFTVKHHLDVLMKDKMFGKLGVANEFVSQDKVDKALDFQVELFRKNKKSVKIGDILENIREITPAHKTAILLTQDRIRDELLAEALHTIAVTEIEKMEINKRFGAIAVKKEMITVKQLKSALTLQEKELKEKGTKRYLGEILKEFFGISDQDILYILKIQKAFETKRLNLKQKLHLYYPEKKDNESLDGVFEFRVSADALNAWIKRLKTSSTLVELTALMNWLAQAGIKSGFCKPREIIAYLQKNQPGDELLIAKGIPPENPKPESAEFFFKVGDWAQEVPDVKKEPGVKKGFVLAGIIPREDGKPGKNVFGRSIPIPDIPDLGLSCGEGVVRKGNEFIADIDGIPGLYKQRTLFVMPVVQSVSSREINGDIIRDTDESYLSCILKLKGNIARGVTVSCHDLLIEGDILGNAVATGDIEVKGSIGKVGEPDETLLDTVLVTAKGSVHVTKNITHAHVFAEKGLFAPSGDIVASEISSFQNIVVKNIFSAKEKISILKIGRQNFFKIDGINAAVTEKTNALNKLSCKEEQERLSKELMDQVQVQNGYMEKQNVISCLKKILEDPDLASAEDISDKVKAAYGKDKDFVIPGGTKAYAFMEKIIQKLKELSQKDQDQYVRELSDSISRLYRAAVKATDEIEKKYEAGSKSVQAAIEMAGEEISGLRKQIEELESQKEVLLLNQEKSEAMGEPVIKVKNRVDAGTLIKGERSELKIETAVHGVSIKEDQKISREGPKIVIEGYFE